LLCFLFCCMTMGLSRWFFVEAKSFEFALEKGISVLRFFERSRGFMRSISIGRVIVHWLLATMERLLEAEESMELLKSYRDGFEAFFLSRVA